MKPPYRVPLMSEIAKIDPNGLTVASLFAGAGGSSLGYRLAGFTVIWASEFVSAAREVYEANKHPITFVDDRDIRDVDPREVLTRMGCSAGDLDVLDGSPPCFAAGTMILTRRGMIPVESVRVGDEVVTHKSRWRSVAKIMSREAHIIAVRGQGHPGIRTTAEHPFFVRRCSNKLKLSNRAYIRDFQEPEWKEVGECVPTGDKVTNRVSYFWGTLRNYPDDIVPPLLRSNARTEEIEMNDAFFWIVGLWLGDGWLRTGRAHVQPHLSRGEVLICAGKHEADVVRERIEAANFKFSETEMRTAVRFTICHSGLAEWLREDFGKTVPAWALGLPENLRRALFDGYIFADGTYPKPGYTRSSSISWSLTLGMSMIARSLGLAASLRCVTRANNSIIENRKVNVAGSVYVLDCYDKPRSCLVEDGAVWGKIKGSSDVGDGTVYNLHVEEDESYIADGLIVHNCASFSMQGKRERDWGKEKGYCVDPTTQVLCTDLVWRSAEDLSKGDEIVAFDENTGGKHRRFKRAVIETADRISRPCFRIRTTDGTEVISSEEHRWLFQQGRNLRWKTTGKLKVGDALLSIGKPWSKLDSYEAGYLAGIFDGEGYVSRKKGEKGTGVLGFAQRKGTVLDSTANILRKIGAQFGLYAGNGTNGDVVNVNINGGSFGRLRVLGILRPARLMQKSHLLWEGVSVSASNKVEIESIVPLGERDVIALSTTAKTFIANGLLSHNSGKTQRTDDLFDEYVRFVRALQPKVFVAENVAGLARGTAKGHFLRILAELRACGYRVEARLLDAQWLGVPQQRARVIFIGVREDLGIEPAFPRPLLYRYSQREAFVGVDPAIEPECDIARFAIGRAADSLVPGRWSDRYQALGRNHLDEPSFTVTVQGGNSSTAGVIHPTEKRKFSIAELKRICGFPDDMILTGSFAERWERLGRAVPPPMAAKIAETVRDEILLRAPARTPGLGRRSIDHSTKSRCPTDAATKRTARRKKA